MTNMLEQLQKAQNQIRDQNTVIDGLKTKISNISVGGSPEVIKLLSTISKKLDSFQGNSQSEAIALAKETNKLLTKLVEKEAIIVNSSDNATKKKDKVKEEETTFIPPIDTEGMSLKKRKSKKKMADDISGAVDALNNLDEG